MARRYIGNLKIYITYIGSARNGRDEYAGSVVAPNKQSWKFKSLYAPSIGLGTGVAYDSSTAYDRMAQSAASFAAYYTTYNRGEGLPDWAPSADLADEIDEASCWALREGSDQYEIRRSPAGKPVPSPAP